MSAEELAPMMRRLERERASRDTITSAEMRAYVQQQLEGLVNLLGEETALVENQLLSKMKDMITEAEMKRLRAENATLRAAASSTPPRRAAMPRITSNSEGMSFGRRPPNTDN